MPHIHSCLSVLRSSPGAHPPGLGRSEHSVGVGVGCYLGLRVQGLGGVESRLIMGIAGLILWLIVGVHAELRHLGA